MCYVEKFAKYNTVFEFSVSYDEIKTEQCLSL